MDLTVTRVDERGMSGRALSPAATRCPPRS